MTEYRRFLSRAVPVAAALAYGLALGGCTSTPDWANPVHWYKSATSVFESDEQAKAARERAHELESNGPGTDQPYPHLSSVPNRPADVATPADKQRVQDALVSDRAKARHRPVGGGMPGMATLQGAPAAPVLSPRPPESGGGVPSLAPTPAPAVSEPESMPPLPPRPDLTPTPGGTTGTVPYTEMLGAAPSGSDSAPPPAPRAPSDRESSR